MLRSTLLDMADVASDLAVRLPRAQVGSSPQHLLVTLLGDLWYDAEEAIPASVLMALLGEFDVSVPAARSAINRLIRRGLLESSREGRAARYVVTPRAREILTSGLATISLFTSGARPWDGRWTVAAFSVAEAQREVRSALRNRLRWIGFAPLYDALWVSPHGQPEAALSVFDELGVVTASVFRTVEDLPSPRPPVSAWDLDALAEDYRRFLEENGPEPARLRDDRVALADALVDRTRLMDRWRYFVGADPDLPPALLPDDWPRPAAARAFTAVYDGLGELALLRAREVIAPFDAGLAERLSLHSVSGPA